MQQQKAASTPQWYVTAADSPTHGRRKQPKRPPTGEWTTNHMRFIHRHTPQDPSPVTKNLKSLVCTVTEKPQQHDAEQLKKPDANKYNRDSI